MLFLSFCLMSEYEEPTDTFDCKFSNSNLIKSYKITKEFGCVKMYSYQEDDAKQIPQNIKLVMNRNLV